MKKSGKKAKYLNIFLKIMADDFDREDVTMILEGREHFSEALAKASEPEESSL